jgi:hypothetical protein
VLRRWQAGATISLVADAPHFPMTRRHRSANRDVRRAVAIAVATTLVVAGCSGGDGGDADAAAPGVATGSAGSDATAEDGGPAGPTMTIPPTATVVASAPPTSPPEPVCTATVEPGDTLIAIATRSGLTVDDLEVENLIHETDPIHPGQVLDVCIGNDTDDITGASRLAPPPAAVRRQQEELNELFSDYSLLELGIDGDSGKYTRQAVCAARMGLGLPVHNGHLAEGSDEEAAIFAATELSIPDGAPTDADKWILIDQRCQVIFTGEGDDRVVDVFPTSTGEPGHETFNVRARAFRYDPAADNGGWHDSSSYPVSVDNPLNGNMYKPIYFNDGQALHGAGYIPPEPQSKGCARTFPSHQNMIIEWLGLDERTEATWVPGEIGVMVVVQGRYVDPTADDDRAPADTAPPTTAD